MKAPTTLLSTLLAAAVLAGCQEKTEPARQTLGGEPADPAAGGLPAAVQAQVDSGNAAYRSGNYEAALAYYREAARRGPEEAAPWFGVSMAAEKLGNEALRDSARGRVRELSPQMSTDVHAPADPAAASGEKAPGSR